MPEIEFSSPHFTLRPVADGVFVAIATDTGFGLCNSGIVDLGDGTAVFDSMLTPQAGADLRRAAERLTGHPVTYLINSHFHGDHVRGNASFPSVRIVSTRKVRQLMDEGALQALESDRQSVPAELENIRRGVPEMPPRDRVVFEGWFEGILATPKGTAIPGPDLFVDDRLALRGPKRELWVMTFGGGHSPSDVVAFLPDEKVGFLGDLLSIGFHPGVTNGFAEPWIEILNAVRNLGVERVLPGHGPLGQRADILAIQEYLRVLLDLARTAHRSGLSREELRRIPMPEAFNGWVFRSFFHENLAHVYDLTRG
ncbi:MAG TPA: MBL fold metallo-hydrolase [Thermoplasmata archaeon]|nr:MBL fold metallo-hydrolase [Thermoplasmata archaeon]